MVVKLSSLRVAAELDTAGYIRSMQGKVAADQAGAASSREVGNEVQRTDQKINAASDGVSRLSRQFIGGYRQSETFLRAINLLGRQMDMGAISADRADAILEGLHIKYGLLADDAALAAAGQVRLAAVVAETNKRLLEQGDRIQEVSRDAAFRTRNLSFQMIDIAQSIPLAFQSPIYALQNLGFQMAQIGQIYMGQGGMRAALADMGGLLGRLTPLLLRVGIPLAGLGVAFAAVTHEINRNAETQVSIGDVMVATWQLATEKILGVFKPVTDWFAGLWDWISPHIATAVEGIIDGFDLAFRDIKTIWSYLPAAIGEVAIGAANSVISAMHDMLARSLLQLSGWATAISGVPVLGAIAQGLAGLAAGAAQGSAPLLDNPLTGSTDQLQGELAQNRLDVFSTSAIDAISERAQILARSHDEAAAAAGRNNAAHQKLAREGLSDAEKAAQRLAETLERTLGSALSSLFDGPITSLQDALDGILGSFAQLGQQNLSSVFSGLFAANDNAPTGESFASQMQAAVEQGAKDGTAQGAFSGLSSFLKGNASTISAGLGGLGIGYQTQDPLMGALGGAASGFAVGGIWGAVIGGIAGLVGGLMGMSEALDEARARIDQNRNAIDRFIAAANGEEVSKYASALADLQDQFTQLIDLAEAANDQALIDELNAANDNALSTLAAEYQAELEASINALAGYDYLNQVQSALDLYNQRLADAATLGVSADSALQELNLSILNIAASGDLTAEQIKELIAQFPQLAGALSAMLSVATLSDLLTQAQSDLATASADLRDAYYAESQALEDTIDRLGRFQSSIEDFKQSLLFDTSLSTLSPLEQLLEAATQYQETSAAALAGDATAQSQLEDVARQYLQSAQAYYGSSEAYAAIFDDVQNVLDAAIVSAGDQIETAQSQLDVLNEQVGALIDIDTSVKAVADAIADLTKLNEKIAALEAQIAQAQLEATNATTAAVGEVADGLDKLTYRKAS